MSNPALWCCILILVFNAVLCIAEYYMTKKTIQEELKIELKELINQLKDD